ncbi:VOC family protein [Streptomyces sp. NPDC050418]|uniref:VOC family protein n=1 Tax=Streptomyces sp. NPDC050418 TaxID=3365612 RepID=UPI003795BEBB
MLTTDFVNGSLVWVDLGTPDIAAANAFYGTLFGWEAEASEEFGGYVTYRSGGKMVAGGMQVPPEEAAPAWGIYFQTSDADASAKSIEQASGTQLMAPMDVGPLGRMALFGDPAGAAFGLWQPGEMKGFEAVNEPGALNWVELYTTDVPAAAAFYGSALGLGTTGVDFPGGAYTTVHPGTDPDGMYGGLANRADDPAEAERAPHWLPYFEVADVDATVAKARELGASVEMEPMSLPGVGRLAKITDPLGARLALIKGDPDQA